ncbi:MAG TPA: DJ-1/PfpI family protein, partial [Candidatus Choladousia intestinigallinarum]|nr:DJ-1/PfpI family protein [Candidatus Choladousia intestinigallinarum]
MVVSVFLFDDFETMDAFMPVQLFGMLKEHFYVRMLSKNGGLMNSAQGVKVWTEPLNPIEIEDILVIPGGVGAKRLLNLDKDMQPLLRKAAENTDYCISIREGTGLLVQSGILYHRTAA